MFIKVILFAVSLCVIKCKLNNVTTNKDHIEYWKPEHRVDRHNSIGNENQNKNEKPFFRHHEFKSKSKKNTKTSKWPKVTKQSKEKLAQRMTKMKMMQQEETTTTDEPLNDEIKSKSQSFSPYNIKQELLELVQNIPKVNATVEVIGRTVEYNDIVLLKMTEGQAKSDKYIRSDQGKYAEDLPEKKIIFIVHGLSVMGIHRLLCLTYDSYFLILLKYYISHLDKFDIFLIPMANPDGIVRTRTTTFLWDKNASPQNDCPGVALDRNFDVAWNKNNRSMNSCHQEYPGPTPFSETETRAIRDIFHKYSHKIVAYIHVHAGSYTPSIFKGDAVLYPKGYTDSSTDDDKYIDLKGEIDEVMRNSSFQVVSVAVDTLYSWYGKVSGSSVDYASTVYGIPFALELVMQIYEESVDYAGEQITNYDWSALTEIWQRVIGVIFNFIWKTLNGNDVR